MKPELISRIIRFKTGIREIVGSIFQKPLTFREQEAKRQMELMSLRQYAVGEAPPYFRVEKDGLQVFLRKGSSDLSVFEQIFIMEEYKALVSFVQLNQIQVNSIVDLGGNIGLASLYFHRYFPQAHYICVEPDDQNFAVLTENLKSVPHLELYKKAIWIAEGELGLDNHFRDGLGWSMSVSENKDSTSNRVQSITLDKIIRENHLEEIGILKMDIEGSEFVLFKHIEDVAFLEKVKVIAIEIHEDAGSKSAIIEKLLHYHFLLFEYSETIIGINQKLSSSAN